MKILAIGCSFTFGMELSDCPPRTDYTGIPASKFAYPELLAKKYNGTVTNLSLPGGSNSRIFRLAIDATCRENYDLVICGWTDHARMDFRYENKDLPTTATSIWCFKEFPWVENYYKYHHDYSHSWQVWLTQVIALQNHFKLKNQKYVFLSMDRPLFGSALKEFPHITKDIDVTRYLGWFKSGMTEFMGDCPKGAGGHPLELGHQRIAERIDEHIRNLGWVS